MLEVLFPFLYAFHVTVSTSGISRENFHSPPFIDVTLQFATIVSINSTVNHCEETISTVSAPFFIFIFSVPHTWRRHRQFTEFDNINSKEPEINPPTDRPL